MSADCGRREPDARLGDWGVSWFALRLAVNNDSKYSYRLNPQPRGSNPYSGGCLPARALAVGSLGLWLVAYMEGPPPVTNRSVRDAPLRRDLWPRLLAARPPHGKAEDTNALLALRGVHSCLRHLLAPTSARKIRATSLHLQGAFPRSAGVLTGSTTSGRSDAAGRHAIRHRHAADACPLRGEVGRRRVGPRAFAHRLRLLAAAMS